MNPEGIGMQPMYANVSMQIKFLGGSDLQSPIEELQNAISANYYANTSTYDILAQKRYIKPSITEVQSEPVESYDNEEYLEGIYDDSRREDDAMVENENIKQEEYARRQRKALEDSKNAAKRTRTKRGRKQTVIKERKESGKGTYSDYNVPKINDN
jgi:hypothetical protein